MSATFPDFDPLIKAGMTIERDEKDPRVFTLTCKAEDCGKSYDVVHPMKLGARKAVLQHLVVHQPDAWKQNGIRVRG